MKDNFPDWQSHELEVSELLGIDQTVSSGNKFYDISDAVTREHVLDDSVQFMADMKATIRKTFRVDRDFVHEYRERAILRGKTFLMPIRFENLETKYREDWVLLHVNDFSELLGLDTKRESLEKQKNILEKEKRIISELGKVSESIDTVLSDKRIPNASRKAMLDVQDVIDELYFEMLNGRTR